MNKQSLDHLLRPTGRPVIMGILNVTPDSFYDGGRYFDRSSAIDRVFEMAENGADIIDIGGESSRPGAEPVAETEELDRVLPIIEEIAERIQCHISIDTYKSNVAKQAVAAGASIINDISALRFDIDMALVAAETGAYAVLMHMLGNPLTMQNNPQYNDVFKEVCEFLRKRVKYAVDAGIKKENIIIDPGIGFGKRVDHNLTLLRHIGRFRELGYPILTGASNKSMISTITGATVEDRSWGTAAVVAHCVSQGVTIHRVHNVKAMKQVCEVSFAIKG